MIAWLFNIGVPGTGLIFHRREWLGFVLSILFGVFANVALAGRFVVPEALPPWVLQLSIALTVLTWVSGQIMLAVHIRQIRRQHGILQGLLSQARQALEAGNMAVAADCIENGFLVDEGITELHVLSARLCAMQGDRSGEVAAWRRVLQLDARSEFREEAIQVLQTRA